MSIRGALLYSFSTRYAAMALQFIATVVLARLLTPAQVGTYSVGAAVVMIAQTLRDFGTSTYVVQERELTDARLATAFTVTIIVAWTLGALLLGAAGTLGRFYGEGRVGGIARIMALSFFVIPFGSIGLALLRRAMNFRAIMYITVASTVVHSLVAVVLAAAGFGADSLAWAAVCGTVATVAGSLLAHPAGFIRRLTLSERSRVLGFSVRSSANSIAAEAGHSAPDLVLGRTVGMDATGMFSRAMGYVQLFERLVQDALRNVMLPYLAQQERSGGDVADKLRFALENIASVSWFAIGLIAVLASPTITLLYGQQWAAAVPVAQIVCIGIALRCIAPTLAAAIVARGRMDLILRNTTMATAAKFSLLILASLHGLMMGSVGFVAAEVVGLLVLIHYAAKCQLCSWRGYLSIVAKCAPAAQIGIAPAAAIVALVPAPSATIELLGYVIVAGVASAGTWLVAVWTLSAPPKAEIRQILEWARRRRPP